MNDLFFMRKALAEAQKAFEKEEAPIGAIAVHEGKIIARAHNLREKKNDPLGHAEIILMRKISQKFKNWRLLGITVYVTLEPCPMCMGALMQARVKRLVFGAMNPKVNVCGSLEITHGLLEKESAALLKKFFAVLRKKGKK